LIVELDDNRTHGTRTAFERDRARDRRLVAAGWRVIRITWLQLQSDRPAVLRDVAAALGSPRIAGQNPLKSRRG
jgi:very-short-patch-repair endonuclease